jgi:dienelactone hydrolase
VSGVSWYEAAAYAEFIGKDLPTVYHWASAAGILATPIMALSNFGNQGPRPVGSHGGVGPFGTYDMAGNVREWCWNETTGGARYILGGAWNDSAYQFTVANARSPLDRSPGNGFRTVLYEDKEVVANLARPVEFPSRDYAREQPVSDEIFKVYRDHYSYDATELDPVVEQVEAPSGGWRIERVTFRAGYGSERVSAYLFLPSNVKPPYQTLLFFPGATAVMAGSSDSLRAGPGLGLLEFLVLSGRAVLFPIYYGTFERNDGRRTPWPEATPSYRDWAIRQVKDAKRSLDYLATRPDIDVSRLGYLGVSWGVQIAPGILAQESRVRTAVFVSGGFTPAPFLPEVDPLNFAARVSIPVLMLNGDGDNIYPLETAQKPLFTRLGTPNEHKRHVVYNGGHDFFATYPRQSTRETLAWLDTYLGPVK